MQANIYAAYSDYASQMYGSKILFHIFLLVQTLKYVLLLRNLCMYLTMSLSAV